MGSGRHAFGTPPSQIRHGRDEDTGTGASIAFVLGSSLPRWGALDRPPRRSALRRRPQGTATTMPPSTWTFAPVTYDAAGESRKAPTRPSSAGSP